VTRDQMVWILALAATACVRREGVESAPAEKPAPPAPAVIAPTIAPEAAPPAASGADCDRLRSRLRWKVVQGASAMSARPAGEAREQWKSFPVDCRDGEYFALGAAILHSLGAGRLDAGDLQVASTLEALRLGLDKEPDDLTLLAYMAYLGSLDASLAPPLPVDACTRARALAAPSDAAEARTHRGFVAYVCGHAALRAGQAAQAAEELATIEISTFPDAVLRRIQALVAAGKRKEARALKQEASRRIETQKHLLGVNESDAPLLRKQLAAALK